MHPTDLIFVKYLYSCLFSCWQQPREHASALHTGLPTKGVDEDLPMKCPLLSLHGKLLCIYLFAAGKDRRLWPSQFYLFIFIFFRHCAYSDQSRVPSGALSEGALCTKGCPFSLHAFRVQKILVILLLFVLGPETSGGWTLGKGSFPEGRTAAANERGKSEGKGKRQEQVWTIEK